MRQLTPRSLAVLVIILALLVSALLIVAIDRRERQAVPVKQPLIESLADTLDTRKVVLRCLASWYGYPEHGRKTASGETFDSTALTAAIYRPFLRQAGGWGKIMLVRCTYNRRTVMVRITDAMPSRYAKEGRMLDLSKAAAESLGMVRQGVAPVECWKLADSVEAWRK